MRWEPLDQRDVAGARDAVGNAVSRQQADGNPGVEFANISFDLAVFRMALIQHVAPGKLGQTGQPAEVFADREVAQDGVLTIDSLQMRRNVREKIDVLIKSFAGQGKSRAAD